MLLGGCVRQPEAFSPLCVPTLAFVLGYTRGFNPAASNGNLVTSGPRSNLRFHMKNLDIRGLGAGT